MMMRWKMEPTCCGQLRCSTCTCPYYVFLPMCGTQSRQFLKGDVAFLDFSSHHVSINHADTVTGFKGLEFRVI